MYTRFFGFAEKPFNVTPDPKFLYLTASHREALASMMYGITERRGYITITGEVGTGKTTLIYSLINQLSEKVRPVCVFHTALTFEQLLRTILTGLKLPASSGDKAELLRQFNQHLREQLTAGEIIALIIDEAQNVPDEVLEEIRLLSNLETEKEKLLQIVFVGQPEFERKLQSEHLRQLRQRIVMRRTIAPLPEKDIKEYIEHRLKLVGSTTAAVFTAEAVSLICQYSLGIPRTINTICDNAFLIGYGLSQNKIDDRIIIEALQDMEGGLAGLVPGALPKDKIVYPRPSFPMSSIAKNAALAILILCVISLIAVLAREFTRGKSPEPPVPIAEEVSRQQEASTALAAPGAETIAPPSAPAEAVPGQQPSPAAQPPADGSNKAPVAAAPPVAETEKPAEQGAAPPAPVQSSVPAASAAREIQTITPTAAAPASSVTKEVQSVTATAAAPPPAIPAPADMAFKRVLTIKKTIKVQKGDTIYSLAREYYQTDNRTIIDLLLLANPQIQNAGVIMPNERFRLPDMNASALVMESGENDYKIHLATYANPSAAQDYQNEPALKDFKIEVIPYTMAPREGFYRIVAGPFKNRDECLPVINQLKDKRLLPALAPAAKTP